MTRRLPLLLIAAGALAAPAAAEAEPAVGLLGGGDVLAHFDTATPGQLERFVPVTGLGPGERLVGLDYRYLLPEGTTTSPGLFGIATNQGGSYVRLYRLDPGTGAAAPVGAVVLLLDIGQRFGIDFNPTADRVRVVNDNHANLRLNPNSGTLSGLDTDLGPAGVLITGIAYDRVATPPVLPAIPTNTSIYAIDNTSGKLGTLGGLNSTPSPNGGVFNPIGALGVTPDPATPVDLDISSGIDLDVINAAQPGLATITVGGVQRLYSVNLTTGAATAIGATGARLQSLAILPITYAGFWGVPGAPFPAIAPQPHDVREADGQATMTIFRSGDASSTLPVAWSTNLGQAGTATFAPGQTSTTFTVPVEADSVDEPNQTVTVTLASAGIPVRIAPATEAFTVVDDDPTPPPPPTPDITAPAVTVGKLPASITYKKLTTGKGLQVTLTPSEAASLTGTLLGTVKGAIRLRAVTASLASTTLPLASGARTLSLKPRTKDLRRPKRAVTLKLQLTGTDAAGNQGTVAKSIRLKPR